MSVLDFVTFELPQGFKDKLSDEQEEQFTLPLEEQGRILKALQEIYSTPEGRVLIEAAAEASSSGLVHMAVNPGGQTVAAGGNEKYPFTLMFGDEDSDARYQTSDGSELVDMTYQRTLYHEMQHMVRGDSVGPDGEIDRAAESAVIEATNAFMLKYYGEAPRDLNHDLGEFGGTPQFDLNTNFKISP